MSKPVVSVLMTVFNAGRFLGPAVRSILNQTFRNFEFIIVDDASTDGSLAELESFAQSDGRINLIRNAVNKGQTPCLNQGLALARGRWVARQDADDLSHPMRLGDQHQYFTAKPEIVLLGTCGRIVDENDRLLGLLDAPLSQDSINWTSPLLNPFMHTSVMFRTDIVRGEFGSYDESYRIAQDYDLWTRIVASHPTANLRSRLVCYRHLATSLSKAGRERAFAEADRVSSRESERVYGRQLSDGEVSVVRSFREGLDPGMRQEFWQTYRRLRTGFPETPGSRHTEATHHLKVAGAVAGRSKSAAIAEIASALKTDFGATLGWLSERYLNA